MKKKTVIRIVQIILVFVFVFSVVNIVKIYYDYEKADHIYSELQNQYVEIVTEQEKPVTTDTPNTTDKPEKETEPAPSAPIVVDFDSLLTRNKDVIGWLYCPDTFINYPVVQSKDNDQYLRRDLDGNYLISGTIFADYRNGALNESNNYIIYGHNMKNDTMFSVLDMYKDQAYFDQHPIWYYLTPDGNYKIELFAGLVVMRDEKIYNPNLDKEELAELLNDYRANSTFKSDVELEYDDTIVTLSTCSYEFDNARYILIGRLLPL